MELGAAIAVTLAIYALGFALESLPMAFPLLVATVWVGLRFSTLLSVLHSFVLGTIAVVLTLAGVGPFRASSRTRRSRSCSPSSSWRCC